MKLRTAYILCMSAMLGVSSCISDDSTFENIEIENLSIAGTENETMQVFNFNLGNECVITPEITYSGNESDLIYEWSIGTYKDGTKGNLSVVSEERILNYKFTEGGI